MDRRSPPWNHNKLSSRSGLTMLEVLLVVVVVLTLATLCFPLVLQWRETSRLNTCRDHLKHLAQALQQFEETHGTLPSAAVWRFHTSHGLALNESKQIETITHENWVISLLPYLGKNSLYQQFHPEEPIGAEVNKELRTTALPGMSCPSDTYNSLQNTHEFFPRNDSETPLSFARGNYAINGGTHNLQTVAPSTRAPLGDMLRIVTQESPRQFQMWGNGIAGINKSFSSGEFKNGRSTLVALEEVRAGIHPLDPRGVWALGQIGGSITWSHGVNGDAFGPNNQWDRSDDILGGGILHEILGEEKLLQERMPCVAYVDTNAQAAARSQHLGGVQVAFCDGSVRFVSDKVDPSLWHVMHSRETPSGILATQFDADLEVKNFPEEPAVGLSIPSVSHPERLQNSLGMEFVIIPPGTFQMGAPDRGNNVNPPSECPEHTVRISHPFLMGVHEVTVEQFQKISPLTSLQVETVDPSQETGSLPVTNVTWNQAVEFCQALSQQPEEQQAGRVYRLPTEAEWEYVCRGGSNEAYYWKAVRDPSDVTGEAAGISPALPLKSVGSYPANPYGVHDMRGNAWEWTADWFDRDYYSWSSGIDPQGPSRGFIKVVRGGDWRFIGENCRIDYPMLPPWKGNPFVGFRVVCQISGNSQ